MPHFVYILLCSNGKYYVGSTSNLEARLKDHNRGHGGKYTADHRPVKLLWHEEHESLSSARQREAQLKGWTRRKKEALIAGDLQRLKPPPLSA
ncbi:GIY-YIG nuclease family protein [Elusimicrobiota bacterium]